MVKHLAVVAEPLYAQTHPYIYRVIKLLQLTAKRRIPMLTLHTVPYNTNPEHAADFIVKLMDELRLSGILDMLQIKVTIVGSWYALPDRAIKAIKRVLKSTNEYDKLFLNLCVRYDGHQDITSALKVISKKVELDRLDPEMITLSTIKQHLASSYFIPPDLTILTGTPKLNGLFLWDMKDSRLHFTNKPFHRVTKMDIEKVVREWDKLQ